MIKAVSGLVLHVANAGESLRFYQDLGFQESTGAGGMPVVRLNWFSIRVREEAPAERRGQARGSGIHVRISVEDLESFTRTLNERGVTAHRQRAGGRPGAETLVADPDGYTLVFFESG